MKKIFITIVMVLYCGIVAFGQSDDNDLSALYNALKSAAKANDKGYYAAKMLTLGQQTNQPQSQFLINASLQIVATAFADEGDDKNALVWTQKIQDSELKSAAEDHIASTLIEKKKFALAHSILNPKIATLKKDSQGNIIAQQQELMTSLTYGELLFAEENYHEALHYLYPALSLPKYVEKFKEYYVRAFIKDSPGKINKDLIASVFEMQGKRSVAFKSELKDWFVKNEGSDSGYHTLEERALLKEKTRLEELIAKLAMNKPAPDFEVLDINGKTISLASLRGKTVVLDFWATWCQPCVASFPGMQKAVNFFRHDPNVVFMFIHTLEKKGSDVKTQAQQLLSQKGYDFDVYLDLRDPSTDKSPAAEKFQLTAIPAKFIINKEGIIKFSHTGYVSEDEAVEEIKMMIEKANEK
jgi:peroxiredoxin